MMNITDGIKIFNGITNSIEVANSLFEFGKNVKGEDNLKINYNLICTEGTRWSKLGDYDKTNEICLYIRELEQDNFLSYPMDDFKYLKVGDMFSYDEPYHLLIKNDGQETINNILIKIDFEDLVIVKKESYNNYNWIYEKFDGYLEAYRSMKLIIDKLITNDSLIIPFNILSNDIYISSYRPKMSVTISADKCNKISYEHQIYISI